MNFPTHIPFVTSQGFTLEQFGEGTSQLGLVPREDQLNSFGVVHGGVVMTLLDVAMAHAARAGSAEDMEGLRGAVTIEMKTSFMEPCPANAGKLMAKGKLLKRTATLAFTEGQVYDSQGRLCAHATGTFKLVRGVATSTREIKPFAGKGSD